MLPPRSPSGFSIKSTELILPEEKDRLERLARYLTRAPLRLNAVVEDDEGRIRLATPPDRATGATERILDPLDWIHVVTSQIPDPGPLFEQWVGIEIWKRLQYRGEGALSCYRTKAGAEVDFIVELGGKLIPLEVKWTEHPTRRGRALPAYVPGRQPRPRTDGLSRVPLRAPPAPLGARDGTAVVGGVASPVARALGRGGRRRAAAGDARRRV